MTVSKEELTNEILRLLDVIGDALKTDAYWEITTCDAPNWDQATHNAMYDLQKAGIKGCTIGKTINHGCHDWIVRLSHDREAYELGGNNG